MKKVGKASLHWGAVYIFRNGKYSFFFEAEIKTSVVEFYNG